MKERAASNRSPFRVPASQQQAVAMASNQLGISRSEFFRNALEHELEACSV
jgi:hypothetical protein